jgi:hypothetical protein
MTTSAWSGTTCNLHFCKSVCSYEGTKYNRTGGHGQAEMKFMVIIVCFLLVAVSVEADADEGVSELRCDQYVISRGASQFEVLIKCGRPSNVEAWQQERIRMDFYKDIPVQSEEELSEQPLILKEFIKVEEWEYNFGPNRFIHYLGFENGKLESITVGSYGY